MTRAVSGPKRGPSTSEAAHRSIVEAALARQAANRERQAAARDKQADEDAVVALMVEAEAEAGRQLAPSLAREALHTHLAGVRQAEEARQLAAARRLLTRRGGEQPNAPATEPLPARTPPGPDPDKYLTLAQCEEERHRLARSGKPHGYDSLSRKRGPFPGMRSTIVRRYKGKPPPGEPIPGVCENVRPHAHA